MPANPTAALLLLLALSGCGPHVPQIIEPCHTLPGSGLPPDRNCAHIEAPDAR